MGIFDFLKKDPTTYWNKSSKQKLKLDLNDFSINKLKLGAPKAEISRFGKPDNKKAYKSDNFQYFESGLEIDTENDVVNYFAIIITENEYSESILKAELTVVNSSSEEFTVTNQMSRTELIEKFNMKIKETDEDDEEIVDYLKTDKYTIEIESMKNGKLIQINLYIND